MEERRAWRGRESLRRIDEASVRESLRRSDDVYAQGRRRACLTMSSCDTLCLVSVCQSKGAGVSSWTQATLQLQKRARSGSVVCGNFTSGRADALCTCEAS